YAHPRAGDADRLAGSRSSDTPDAWLLQTLASIQPTEFEALGLEPWEMGLGIDLFSGGVAPTKGSLASTAALAAAASTSGGAPPHADGEEQKRHLERLSDALSQGVWPTYARLACVLDFLTLRAIHAQLCQALDALLGRSWLGARAPLPARACGAVPFHPCRPGGEALGVRGGPQGDGSPAPSDLGKGLGSRKEDVV
ncbi:unnamed protein product, partial [Discosporangium mesarthrocarpum]